MAKAETMWDAVKKTVTEKPAVKATLVVVLLLTVTAVAALLVKNVILPGGQQSREELRGVTDEVTVETYAPNQPIPAQTRPETLPPIIAAEGPCKTTLDQIRDIFDTTPSWYAADKTTQEKLNTLLNEANPQNPDGTCDEQTYNKFIQQELVPWQNYTVPEDQMKETPKNNEQ